MSIELRYLHDRFHVRRRFRILLHRLEILTRAPLGIIRHSHPVRTLMNIGRDKAR